MLEGGGDSRGATEMVAKPETTVRDGISTFVRIFLTRRSAMFVATQPDIFGQNIFSKPLSSCFCASTN